MPQLNVEMEYILLGVQLLFLAILGLLFRYVKGLPDAIHNRSLRKFQHKLNKELEQHRAQMTREIELLKIAQSQLQVHKTQEFTKLVDFYNEILSDPDKVQKRLNDKRQHRLMKQTLLDLGTKLFFFASDSTIRQYIAFRDYTISIDGNHDPLLTMRLYGEFMASVRRDLGHDGTECNEDDFLRLILTDWNHTGYDN